MSDQEVKYFQDFQEEEDSICQSMLHPSTAVHHHPSAAAPPKTTSESRDTYIAAHNSSAKRQSPSIPSQFQEPVSKKATLHAPSSPSTTTTTAAVDYHLLGFTKLPLPQSLPAASPPSLRRTLSDPIYSPGTVSSFAPPPQLPKFPTSPVSNQLRKMSSKSFVQESVPFPNSSSVLHRTVSDPNPVVNQQVVAAASTPPRPPVGRNASRSPSCGDSPSTKRLKRMRDRLKEMSQWWNQVVSEDDEEEDREPENQFNGNSHREESENDMENPSQEAVWVEKKGESLILHFECPCGNGYQILLSGKNCYYKLTNF